MGELLTMEQAQAAVLERARALPAEPVPLEQAAGRMLAESARAAVDLPPFPSSAMDGYAVRAADLPGRLRVVGRIAAGRPADRALAAGEAMAIATGGTVPDGADAVIPVEYVVEHDNEEVEFAAPARPGANIRPRAGDAAVGDEVVAAGVRLAPAQVGALAAAGVAAVRCTRRPRVAILATGTELRPPGEELRLGEIYDSNTVLLSAAVASAGAEADAMQAVADEPDEHRRVLEAALERDVVVTSGGVSVGPHDLVRRTAEALGVEEVFWRVAMKPGKPASFGVRGRTLVFGLPGNPVSSLVGFELFVRPALLALQGAADPGPSFSRATLAADVARDEARDQLVRARTRTADGRVALEPVSGQESHMIVRAAGADALVLVPRGAGTLVRGETVEYLPLA